MAIEYSAGKRRASDFPKHWRGITAGQESEERAAAIIVNIAADLEARGKSAEAEAVRQHFINGGDHSTPDIGALVRRYVDNPGSAQAALDLANGLGRNRLPAHSTNETKR